MKCKNKKYHIVVIPHKMEFYVDDYSIACSIVEEFPHAQVFKLIDGIYTPQGDVTQ